MRVLCTATQVGCGEVLEDSVRPRCSFSCWTYLRNNTILWTEVNTSRNYITSTATDCTNTNSNIVTDRGENHATYVLQRDDEWNFLEQILGSSLVFFQFGQESGWLQVTATTNAFSSIFAQIFKPPVKN